MSKRKIISIMLVCILTLSMTNITQASELNFGVSAVIPDNQIDQSQTYFDLHMEPNKRQTIEVLLRNDTKKDITIEINVNTAMTNNNGIIDYSQTEFARDSSMKIDIENLVEYEKKVTIKAESTLTYPLTIQMPDEEIDGLLLGGIQFQEKEDETDKKENKQINNKFAYIIGLKLSMNDVGIKPNSSLKEIVATHINYRNALIANIQNSTPTIISPLEINANIYKEKGKKALFTSKKDKLRMAPNSNFNYAIDLERQEFKPGKYRLEMEASSGEDTWNWTEYFTIEKDEARELNKNAVAIEKNYTTWYIVGGSILFVFLLGFFYWLGTRKQKEQK